MSYRVVFTKRFQKDYKSLPGEIQNTIDRQIKRLAKGDFSYPSLRAKKMEGEAKVWEASITMNYRMVFYLEEDSITFLKAGIHDMLE